jgi:KipI family sensor histidine kinase inhibitor
MKSKEPPRFLNAGEAALVVEFGSTVDPAISDLVLSFDAALSELELPGVQETVPTYRSLMIHYDPLALSRDALISKLREIQAAPAASSNPSSVWTIPCCYDPQFGEDLGYIAQTRGLSSDQVVALHSGASYRVYMYGFAPGFTYLGGLPSELAVSRRMAPRPPHPTNTVLIGGGLSLISTVSMPTGWWLVGRTPERMFSLEREQSFLVQVGDELRFEPIDVATFHQLEARVAAGEIVARQDSKR